MNSFEIKDLEVGGNFINLKITDNNCHEAELHFWQMPKKIINETLKIYGIFLTDEELKEYEEF